MAHRQARNTEGARNAWRRELTSAFPQFNSGVMAYRRTEPVLAFLGNWRDEVLTSKARYDQPCLRELLWESDLRIATLPPEYNFRHYRQLCTWSKSHRAPRILHSGSFHTNGNRPAVRSVSELLGPALTRRLRRALRSDAEIRNEAKIQLLVSDVARNWRHRLLKKLAKLLRPREAR